MNTLTSTPITTSAKTRNDQSEKLLKLLGLITGMQSSSLKGSMTRYYQMVPSLLADSFLGRLISRRIFSNRLKARALFDRFYLPVFEAMNHWEYWNEPLAAALLREVIPALMGITSMQKKDNDPLCLSLALGRIAEQTGKGKLQLISLVCPSYQYRRDSNGRLWHCSGELLPIAGERFGKVADTLGRIFFPLAELGADINWEFWSYTGETGDPEDLIDMARFVHKHYQNNPEHLFVTLNLAAQDMDRHLKTKMSAYNINASICSLDKKFGSRIFDIRKTFSNLFPDQLDKISSKEEVETWLNNVCGCGPLIHSFVKQENIYRQNVLIDFTEPIVSAALREMLLYTHILSDAQNNEFVIIDTESSSNYITETLKYIPTSLIFTRSEKETHDDKCNKYTLNIRQPYNVIPC